jgi:molecular chaperone HtpG
MVRDAGDGGMLPPGVLLPVLELNPGHPLVTRLRDTADDAAFADLALLLFEQAQLAEGGQLEDPVAFVKRLNALILGVRAEGSRIILGS